MKNFTFFLLLLSCTLTTFSQETKAPETLPEIIKERMILKKNQTYIIDKNVIVDENVILVIQEGVTLKINPTLKNAFLMKNGAKFIACGSYENPIKGVTSEEGDQNVTITVKSIYSENANTISAENFSFKTIENPTVLMNTKPIKSGTLTASNAY